jgi:hypothetical protein
MAGEECDIEPCSEQLAVLGGLKISSKKLLTLTRLLKPFFIQPQPQENPSTTSLDASSILSLD